jgi:hypothetical protein
MFLVCVSSCEYIAPKENQYSEVKYLKISGVSTVTANSTRSYYTFYLDNSTYEWSVPEGATIISGQGTSQISVLFGNKSGLISVNAKGMSAVLSVTVK